MRPEGKCLHPLLNLITVWDRWKEARTKSCDVFIHRPNTLNCRPPPNRMTVRTMTLEGMWINQANNKAPDCPLALLANKDI